MAGTQIFYRLPRSVPEERVTVRIPSGSSLQAISDSLYKYQVIKDKDFFQFLVRLQGLETSLQAGIFEIPEHASHQQVLYALTHSRPRIIDVTVIEGLTSRQIARLMEQKFRFDSSQFRTLVTDSALVSELGIPGPSLEGFLFPDTYKFFENESAESVIRKMVEHFFAVVPDSFYVRAEELGWSMWEAITLASIIEGEAVYDDERAMVSSVFHNRLERGMRLQADPTIQYIIEEEPRRLLNRDLEIDSPYNTYLYAGLPPGPINNPGFQSIHAALYPEESDYLYFVARGDGYHTFSLTNSEHILAKQHLQKLRRQVYLEQQREQQKSSL